MKNTGAGVNYHLLTSPDDIMWLLNIRGSDYTYSPLISSFAIAGEDQILLFADKKKFPVSLAAEFDNLGIVILPVEEVIPLIHRLPAGSTILINPERTSVALYNAIPSGVKIDEESAIPERLKAVKNSTEIRNIGQVMLKDGVALTRFYYWIESNLGRVPMSEMSLSVKLKDLRSIQEGYIGNSFQTIVAYNDHGALPHYTPSGDSDHVIGENGMLLIDSGAHYFGGTTDITRTISLGTPSHKQKRDFTLVLKGHINLAMAKFPEKTRGYQLDILARKYLWENGLNYGHGTGHGVGYCLNVHEGPQSISPAGNKAIIEPGMLVSNEPAIYREGEYGIRTENLMICYEDEETDFGKFMKFDTVSLCYIDRKLIDKSLLNETEINWLNSYHTGVYEKISPFLNNNEKKWLWEKTSEL
jgi:Xaa-Pro aminopeptidase